MLLVSFVTSIVTGITTVSLMAQDPQGVTQTINRVVERTIEKVSDANNTATVAPPVKEVTVVVKEEEFVTKAVQEAHEGIVRIKNKKDGALIGLGVIVDYNGTIIADRIAMAPYREYVGVYQGVTYDLVPGKQDKKSQIITFTFRDGVPLTINPIRISNTDTVAGQSVVAVSGADRDVVSIGIVSSLVYEDQTNKVLYAIDTTVSQDSLLSGTPFMSLDGTLVALKIGKDSQDQDILMPISRIMSVVNGLANTQ